MTTEINLTQEGKYLGMVVGGSLHRGVEVHLDSGSSVEDVKVGTFVTIKGKKGRFFGVITDIELGVTDAAFKNNPNQTSDPFVAEIISGTNAYGTISVLPTLTIQSAPDDLTDLSPAKNIPSHFSETFAASDQDVQMVFGTEGQGHFWIGNPLEMQTKVCLNLKALVERSMGVFGKTGTGKTFLTRLLLMGILKADMASALIFDMHSEYGWQGRDSDRSKAVKGLKQLFGSKVAVFTLDEDNARHRQVPVDEVVNIGYSDIDPDDVEILRENLGLSEVAAQATYNLERKFGARNWLEGFLNTEGRDAIFDLANDISVNPQALAALHNRLSRLKRYGFLSSTVRTDSVRRIIEHLDRGMHVVLEFGRYGNDLNAYILVANLLTRRIHDTYVRRKEEAEGGRGSDQRPLIIAIEEAHKFLSTSVASQTIFGTIARELRKYDVTLMVIDQRPGAIDHEVMSQIGTKLTCLLEDDRDIDAVLSGAPGGRELRSIISRLETKQQALIFGHAVPMPVVVQTREYGSTESYSQLGDNTGWVASNQPRERPVEDELQDLF